MVSLAFHQLVRSTAPTCTVMYYRLWNGQRYSKKVYISVVASSLGIAMTTSGGFTFTRVGFMLTWLGVVLAVTKVSKRSDLRKLCSANIAHTVDNSHEQLNALQSWTSSF